MNSTCNIATFAGDLAELNSITLVTESWTKINAYNYYTALYNFINIDAWQAKTALNRYQSTRNVRCHSARRIVFLLGYSIATTASDRC